ncbi:MAG: GNAT family N-acetyltransferase [Flavobacteriaceae bacterium]|nr:GNAT family N-acetyltransferase [Bacteroidia bacterium]MBT8288324.1 GNAT family N-acetyltransferase [Bacteroidia bacterium]NNF75100.1 GNAT family N-acetyltransferase [Flavobacteriaceae bacterium]NNK73820.1 GNAT family N-acetyltransferase [Flavobacteriaceae bacterium]
MGNADFTFTSFHGIPDPETMAGILDLYNILFEDADSDFFINRLQDKKDLFSALAYKGDNLVGFKIGYRVDENTFYSWIGGVAASYRRRGIANQLAEIQEKWGASKGFDFIKTKSMNRFKPMMILNLKRGFEITQVYTNPASQTKIVFFKDISLKKP